MRVNILNRFKLIVLFILLLKASKGGHDHVVCLLISHPQFNSLNEIDENGETALHPGEYLFFYLILVETPGYQDAMLLISTILKIKKSQCCISSY